MRYVLRMKPIIDTMKQYDLKSINNEHQSHVFGLPLTVNISESDMNINLSGYDYFVDKTPCNYGNYRYWLICPSCYKRRHKLFTNDLNQFFQCSKCRGDNKRTLNRSHTDCTYYYGLAEREAQKIDPNYKLDALHTPPSRPKYMKRSKYYRHIEKFYEYDAIGNDYWRVGALAIINKNKHLQMK